MLKHRKVVTLFQARYSTVSWNSAHGNAANNEGGRCPSPLTGRRPRVSAEESEVVASASGIMFSRAIGLPESCV